jgi:hypothetical protein
MRTIVQAAAKTHRSAALTMPSMCVELGIIFGWHRAVRI